MLNLKKLRFKVFSDEPQKATLKVKGEKEVKGSDFQLPSQLELINKGEHIATLTDRKGELEIEIEVEKGIGYLPREKRKRGKLAVGEILLDAIFTPMKKVGYQVENMRVGERTDFDKIRMEIETDGTITPKTALSQAAQILVEQFSLVSQSFIEEEKSKAETKEKKPRKKKAEVAKKPAKKKPASSAGAPSRRKSK
jgi:DNA-directed RNA polymerase subunit alpha